MPITAYNKTVVPNSISKYGTTNVQITISGIPEIANNPTDVILLIDASGSMQGQPLADVKTACINFVNLFDEATDSTQDGVIGAGSRIGVIYFNSGATVAQGLTTSVSALTTAINSITAFNGTDATAGFVLAQSTLLASNPLSKKIIVVMSDGAPNDSTSATAAATSCKSAGIEIYSVGIGGSVSIPDLQSWASLPLSTYFYLAPSPDDIEAIVLQIGASIIQPAATDVTLIDTICSDFKILDTTNDTGTVAVSGNQVTWTIPILGTAAVPSATLNIIIQHCSYQCGAFKVNESISYTDAENHTLYFSSPVVNVYNAVNCNCGTTNPQPCCNNNNNCYPVWNKPCMNNCYYPCNCHCMNKCYSPCNCHCMNKCYSPCNCCCMNKCYSPCNYSYMNNCCQNNCSNTNNCYPMGSYGFAGNYQR